MALLTLSQIDLHFSGPKVLDHLDLSIERNERICLIGRNGAGKSTLMSVIEGKLAIDSGEMIRAQGLSCSFLSQNIPSTLKGSVFDIVAHGFGKSGTLISQYNQVQAELESKSDSKLMNRLEKLQIKMDESQSWDLVQRIDTLISKMGLDPTVNFLTLSAGLKRRALLARAIVIEPDILLLDEPTNHLDIESILWMENFLMRYQGTLFFVTHDRQFLQNLATRIVELDRGKAMSWECDYPTFLKRRQELLDNESKQNALFDKRLAQEEVWIRTGIKARRTRNEGRVRALEKMRLERKERKEKQGTAKIQTQEAQKTGRIVMKVQNVHFSYSESEPVIRDFSTTIMRGDKIAFIGPNGVGKTTLIKLLLNELAPSQGSIKLGTNLAVAYFDQLHMQLDENKSIFDNIAEGNDYISINGKSKHVLGYLQDFLFTPEQSRGPVKRLSGGERNRLLLAKLFTKPANVLVLDEPTNDLDAETLELLEELLLDFQGSVLFVSHDRAFINNIATSSFVFNGEAIVEEYVGGYDDWQRQAVLKKQNDSNVALPKSPHVSEALSEAERKELFNLPKLIDKLEKQQADYHKKMEEPGFYDQSRECIEKVTHPLRDLEMRVEKAYERWDELESKY